MKRTSLPLRSPPLWHRPWIMKQTEPKLSMVPAAEIDTTEARKTCVRRALRRKAFIASFALALIAVIAPAWGEDRSDTNGDFRCTAADGTPADLSVGPHWNGWGVDPAQHRFQPAPEAQLAADEVPRLKLKWAFGFPGARRAYAQPTVMGGRLFVGSAGGKVYSLDAKSGCVHWVFGAAAPVRTAISIGRDTRGWSAYFGDQSANAYSVDALSGKPLWRTHLEEHSAAMITGAPTLAGGVLYVPVTSFEEVVGARPRYPCCSFRGSSPLGAVGRWHLVLADDRPQETDGLRYHRRQLFRPAG
jgi:hypothetical protein